MTARAATRTGLVSADPTHQVQQVEILIFEGGNDDAQWIDTETIKEWPKDKSSFTYTLQYPFVEGHSYTLLGVRLTAEYGSGDSYRLRASFYDRPADGFGIAVSGYYTRTGGFFENTFTGGRCDWERLGGGRLKLQWQPGSRLRLDVSSSDFPQYAAHSNYAGVWADQAETRVAHQTIFTGCAGSCIELPLNQ